MKWIAALLLLQCAAVMAQDAAPSNPLIAQRRLAFILREAMADYDRGNYKAVLERLDSLEGAAAGDIAVLNLRAATFTKAGNYEAAMKIFSDIGSANPGYFPAFFNAAELRFLMGDREGALEEFRRLRTRDPGNELLRFKVFLCEVALGRDGEAEKTAAAMNVAGLTPSWYYAQAIFARQKGDEAGAERHLRAAHAIYGGEGCRLFDESLASVKF